MLSLGIIDSFSHDIMQVFLLIKYLKEKAVITESNFSLF